MIEIIKKIQWIKLLRIISISFIAYLLYNYIDSYFFPWIDKKNGDITLKEIYKQGDYQSVRNIFFTPFESNTKILAVVKPLQSLENSFEVDYQIIFHSVTPILIRFHTFLDKNMVIGMPTIKLNNKKIEMKDTLRSRRKDFISSQTGEMGSFYDLEPFLLRGGNVVDDLSIIDLKLRLEPHQLTDMQIPLLFNDKYYTTYTLPTNIPLAISEKDTSEEMIFQIKVPKLKRLQEKLSGWTNITFTLPDYEFKFSGFINQEFEKEGDVATFKSRFSIDNLPFTFDFTYSPSLEIHLSVILFFIFPLIFWLSRKIHHKNSVIVTYLTITAFLGFGALTNFEFISKLINDIWIIIDLLPLIFIVIFPLIFGFLFNEIKITN